MNDLYCLKSVIQTLIESISECTTIYVYEMHK